MEGLNMAIHYNQKFKEDAVVYYNDHNDLGLSGWAKNLGVSKSALGKWVNDSKEQGGKVLTRGSGNYSSDEAKEIARLKKELRDAHIKKSNQHSGKMTEAIYIEVAAKKEELDKERRVSISGMLKHLGVSRSGYNAWLKRFPSEQSKRKARIKQKIQEIYDESYQNYGAPKIKEELLIQGEVIAEKTVGNYMREMGIKAQYIKPYTVTTINSNFDKQLINVLNEQFNPQEPNAAWCSDITYIWTCDGFVYLTSIMDLFSRKIIAWTLSNTLETELVIATINKAKEKRKIDRPMIMYSDRGAQYASNDYQNATEGMILSYSKKAYPWDNACIESFHALIKREWLNRYKIFDYRHAYRLIFEYIETFYNTRRIHGHCGYLSPNQYEKAHNKILLAG